MMQLTLGSDGRAKHCRKCDAVILTPVLAADEPERCGRCGDEPIDYCDLRVFWRVSIDKRAAAMAIAEHLIETFNDDGSIESVCWLDTATPEPDDDDDEST